MKLCADCTKPRRHRDCAYCGCTSHSGGKICGICKVAGIDGPTIRGTTGRRCGKCLGKHGSGKRVGSID